MKFKTITEKILKGIFWSAFIKIFEYLGRKVAEWDLGGQERYRIAYLKKWGDGFAHAVNIEQGVFGIIKDVNPENDPIIYDKPPALFHYDFLRQHYA